MGDSDGQDLVEQALAEGGVPPTSLEDLASNLLWRIGRVSDDGPVTVRVGLASSAALFHELPRLRTASDAELQAAVEEGSLRVEWVGSRPRMGSER